MARIRTNSLDITYTPSDSKKVANTTPNTRKYTRNELQIPEKKIQNSDNKNNYQNNQANQQITNKNITKLL